MRQLYVKRISVIHNLNFWTKFLCLLLVIPLCGFVASPTVLLAVGVAAVALVRYSRVSLRTFWDATKLYDIAIIIGILILTLVFLHGTLINRFAEGLLLCSRFITLMSLGILFAMTTNPTEIPIGLMKVRIPHKYGVTVMVAFRMLPLISQKIRSVIDAQKARGARFDFSVRGLPKFVLRAVSLVIPAIYLTLETSVKLSDTLLSRGYDPSSRITTPPTKFGTADFILFSVSAALLTLAIIRF